MIVLKNYQEEAVEQLSQGIRMLLSQRGTGKLCIFKAPTGSGKTLMAARFIERLIRENPDLDLCFLWLSVGDGDLHLQSRDSLKIYFEGSPPVGLVEDDFSGVRQIMERNEVVVASWQKLFLKNNQTGEWKSVLMREGERINFREVLEATRERRKIVLIVDESHIGKHAPRTTELREIIHADVVVEMSATHHEGAQGYPVTVESADVIREGVIKKEVIINEGLSSFNEEDEAQEVVLEAAFQRRARLLELFSAEGSSVKPLVLVQVPNKEEGDAKIEAVERFLARKGISIANGRLAVWTAESDFQARDTVKDWDSPIEWLIFKMAIAKGWDCPRAHILVRFREIESYSFEIQTVGRILRMPELRHYLSEELNRGYIFTDLPSISIKADDEEARQIVKSFRSERRSVWSSLDVPSYYRPRLDYKDITSGFSAVFERVFCQELGLEKEEFFKENRKFLESQGFIVDIRTLKQDVISDAAILVAGIDDAKGTVEGAGLAHFTLAPDAMAAVFERTIKYHLGPFKSYKRSVPKVRTAIYVWCARYLGLTDPQDGSALVQRFFLHPNNAGKLWPLLEQAVDVYASVRAKEIERKEGRREIVKSVEPPVEMFFSSETHERVSARQYLYEPCYLEKDRSRPEKMFESFLDREETARKVGWYWKNGDGGQDYFGVKYTDTAGIARTFYPDYLVWLNDGRLGIFEAKDENDPQGGTETKAKAEALQGYIAEQNAKGKKLWGGIVVPRYGGLVLNQNAVYDWGKTRHDDWADWSRLGF